MSWEDVKAIFRPETVHLGVMAIDKENCTKCGLCIENCPFKCWEIGEDGYPRLKKGYACFSCFNCMIPCPTNAVSIVEPYHVHEGPFATDPHPLPVKMPKEARDAEGKLTEWTATERLVFERRSVRNFKDKPVPESLIRRVLEAGRFAPSGGNCQPWRFIVITDKALLNEINVFVRDFLTNMYNTYIDDEKVKAMAANFEAIPGQPIGSYDPRIIIGGVGSIAGGNLPPLLNAPAVIVVAGDDRAIGGPQIAAGICGQNMSLVAKAIGLGSCWVGFIGYANASPSIMEKLGLQPPWRIVTSIAVGYPKFKQEGMVPREFRPITWFREGASGPEIEE